MTQCELRDAKYVIVDVLPAEVGPSISTAFDVQEIAEAKVYKS